jgi:hypothetical protein
MPIAMEMFALLLDIILSHGMQYKMVSRGSTLVSGIQNNETKRISNHQLHRATL